MSVPQRVITRVGHSVVFDQVIVPFPCHILLMNEGQNLGIYLH